MLRLAGLDETDPGARVLRVVEQMSYFAAPVEDGPVVERWYGVDEIDELSQEEARVLTDRWIAELSGQSVIDAPERLRAPLYDTLLLAMREAARTGTVDAIRLDRTALDTVLSPDDTARVLAWLQRKLVPHDSGQTPP